MPTTFLSLDIHTGNTIIDLCEKYNIDYEIWNAEDLALAVSAHGWACVRMEIGLNWNDLVGKEISVKGKAGTGTITQTKGDTVEILFSYEDGPRWYKMRQLYLKKS